MSQGILVILSGFSGSGKGTVMNALLEKYKNEYSLSISATTRSPREGERDGVEYFFKSTEEFEEMIAAGQLLEYAQYVGNYYGTPLSYVEKELSQGRNVILEIEAQGAFKVKERLPQTTLIFMSPPNAKELKRRLVGRGTETAEVIESRMNRAKEESNLISHYDYLVINDIIDDCVEQIHNIICSERKKIVNNEGLIQNIQADLNAYLKGDQ